MLQIASPKHVANCKSETCCKLQVRNTLQIASPKHVANCKSETRCELQVRNTLRIASPKHVANCKSETRCELQVRNTLRIASPKHVANCKSETRCELQVRNTLQIASPKHVANCKSETRCKLQVRNMLRIASPKHVANCKSKTCYSADSYKGGWKMFRTLARVWKKVGLWGVRKLLRTVKGSFGQSKSPKHVTENWPTYSIQWPSFSKKNRLRTLAHLGRKLQETFTTEKVIYNPQYHQTMYLRSRYQWSKW